MGECVQRSWRFGRGLVGLLVAGVLTAISAAACSGENFSSESGRGSAAGDGATPMAGRSSSNGGEASGGARDDFDASGGAAGAASAEGGAAPSAGGPAASGNGGGGASAGSGGASAGQNPGGGTGGTPPQPIVKASDNFQLAAEGWTIVSTKPERIATHSSTGGHSGGMISGVDDASETWYFGAPAKYLGNASNLYGGVLRFDLKVTEITESFSYIDVQLASANLSLAYDCSPDPSTAWTTFEVPLTEEGWTVETLGGQAATKVQFEQVLANITALRIRGEYSVGDDTGMLDNVYLGTE
jgi:hypothetical protein